MILFNSVIEILAGAVHNIEAQARLDGLRIGSVLVGGHTFRFVTDSVNCLAEEGLLLNRG